MDGAQFRTLRETMGMTREWVSEQLSVNQRTIARWEQPPKPGRDIWRVPFDAEDWLTEWWDLYVTRIKALVNIERFRQYHNKPQTVRLTRYSHERAYRTALPDDPMSLSMHSALVGLVALELAASGFDVEITWVTSELRAV